MAVASGGHDPDCAPLDCSTLTKDTPISVYSPVEGNPQGQIAMAWAGHELTLGWTHENHEGSPPIYYAEAIFQRRLANGLRVAGDTPRYLESVPPMWSATELVVDRSGDLLFAWASRFDQRYRLTRLPAVGGPGRTPAVGAPTWFGLIGDGCGTRGGAIRIFQDGGLVISGMASYDCVGSNFFPKVVAFDAQTGVGIQAHFLNLADSDRPKSQGGGGFVFHEATHTLDAYYGRSIEDDLRVRTMDFRAATAQPPVSLTTPNGRFTTFVPVAAFDGTSTGVLTGESSIVGDGRRRMNFRVFPNTPPVAPTSIPLGFSLEYSQDPASLIWTGDGFVAAITYEVAPNSSNLLDKRVMIVSFDVAGLIREMFDLDTEPAMLPKLSLVAGRVAVTWVRPGRARGGPMTQGFLRFLHCGP